MIPIKRLCKSQYVTKLETALILLLLEIFFRPEIVSLTGTCINLSLKSFEHKYNGTVNTKKKDSNIFAAYNYIQISDEMSFTQYTCNIFRLNMSFAQNFPLSCHSGGGDLPH